MAGLRVPLPMSHPRPRGRRRPTWGQGGSLLLPCAALASATPCRFIPALSWCPRNPCAWGTGAEPVRNPQVLGNAAGFVIGPKAIDKRRVPEAMIANWTALRGKVQDVKDAIRGRS